MSEIAPILSFTLKNTTLNKLFAQLEERGDVKELQHLEHMFTIDTPTFTIIEAFRLKGTKNRAAFFSIPCYSSLTDFVFRSSFSASATRIESIGLAESNDIQNIRQDRGTYATTLTCGLLFSPDETIAAERGKALWKELEERERKEGEQRRWHTLYSMEFLERGWEDAEKKAFEFVSSTSKLLPSGLLELRIGQHECAKYDSQIGEIYKTRKRVNIVKDQKQRIFFPATIREWDEQSGFMTLEVDPAEEIPGEELKALPSRTHVVYNISSDIRTQQEALRRLLKQKVRINTLPLDLFLYGENEAFLKSIRPIYEHDIARANPPYYLQEDKLNEDQKKAVKLALATPDFFFLQGPPGTGKTTFIAELCFQVVQQGGTVLISSQANLAVDNALDRLKNHPDIFAVRLGSKERIHDIGLEFHEGRAIQRWLHSLVDDVQAARMELHSLLTVRNLLNDQWDEICEQYDYYTFWQSKYGRKYLSSAEAFIDLDSRSVAAQEEQLKHEIDLALLSLQQAQSQYEKLQQMQHTGRFDFSVAATFYESQAHPKVLQQISQMRSVLASDIQESSANLPLSNLRMPNLIENAKRLIERWQSSIYAYHLGRAEEALRQLERTLVQLYLRARASNLPSEAYQKTVKAIVDLGNRAISQIQETIYTFGDAQHEVTKEFQKEYQQALEGYRAEVQKKEAAYQDAQAAQDYLTYQKTLKNLREYWHRVKPYISQFGTYQPTEHNGFISFADMQQIKMEWTTTKDEEWEGRLLPERLALLEDWYKVLEKQQSRFETPEAAQKEFIRRANVFGATCSYCGSSTFLKNIQKLRDGKFDYVIIDEVSKVTVNELLIPCLFGKKVILVGDHKQLPPIDHEDIVANIREAAKAWAFDEQQIRMNMESIKKLFYDAFFADRFVFLEKNAPHYNRTMMLTKQYRMHSDIKDAINQFYEERLTQGVSNDKREIPWLREHLRQPTWWLPDPQKHLAWIDISANPNWTHELIGASKSKRNSDEAKLILRILEEIIVAYNQAASKSSIDPIEIGVISMYRAQMRLIERMFAHERKQDEHLLKMHAGITVHIGTVDAFQGRELDIILLSLVLNDRYDDLTSFLKDPRRINVAMSRARRLLLIFGSRYNYIDAPGEAQVIYKRIYDLAGQNAVSLKPDQEFERLRRQPSGFH